MLYVDLRPGQTCHSKDGRSAYSVGVGELGWQYGTGLKSHGTVTDWCTGSEWPVNCMTVVSARWRSNMPFQRRRKWHIPMASYGEILSGRELWYNWVHRKFSQLETTCGEDRKSESFGDQKRWRNDAVEKTAPSRELSPRASSWATLENGKETLMALRVGVNMLQFCSVSNSLSHTTLSNKVRGIFL